MRENTSDKDILEFSRIPVVRSDIPMITALGFSNFIHFEKVLPGEFATHSTDELLL
jgi:hypothetical protein